MTAKALKELLDKVPDDSFIRIKVALSSTQAVPGEISRFSVTKTNIPGLALEKSDVILTVHIP